MTWKLGVVGAMLAALAASPAIAAGPVQNAALTAHGPASDDMPYDPTGRRDPFRPPRASQDAGQMTPLQGFDLGQLRLVAVIYDTATPRAVVEDEAGLGYIVKIGTAIGPNGGAVQAIEKGRVVVREQTADLYGQAQRSEVVMEFAAGDERGIK